MSCSHFFVALLVHTPFVCVIALLVHFLLWQAAKPSGDKCTPFVCVVALLVHLRQVHPLCVRCCFVGALETSAPPLCALLLCWCSGDKCTP